MVGHDSFGDRLFEYLVNCSRMHLFSQHTHVFILCFQDAFEQRMDCLYIISPHSTAFVARVFIYQKTNIHSLLVYGFCNLANARCGQWYTVKVDSSKVTLENRADLLQ